LNPGRGFDSSVSERLPSAAKAIPTGGISALDFRSCIDLAPLLSIFFPRSPASSQAFICKVLDVLRKPGTTEVPYVSALRTRLIDPRCPSACAEFFCLEGRESIRTREGNCYGESFAAVAICSGVKQVVSVTGRRRMA
jgi:hypothetical protein